jgi:pimeloyl-ACP methyl ester carboxylesterase
VGVPAAGGLHGAAFAEEDADDLLAVLNAAGVDQATVFDFGMGGALAFGATYPEPGPFVDHHEFPDVVSGVVLLVCRLVYVVIVRPGRRCPRLGSGRWVARGASTPRIHDPSRGGSTVPENELRRQSWLRMRQNS